MVMVVLPFASLPDESSLDEQPTSAPPSNKVLAKMLPEIVKDFEKENPDIHVDVQALPWDNAHDKLLRNFSLQAQGIC
jgi:ABC-type glycerol-3-phosphate transport system substrate-binding protein